MLKNKNPILSITCTREYFCAYWGQDIKNFRKQFFISMLIYVVFLLAYLTIYNLVFYLNINNPELDFDNDSPEVYVKTILGILNILITWIIYFLYFHKKKFNNSLYGLFSLISIMLMIFVIVFPASIFYYSFSKQFLFLSFIFSIFYIFSQLYLMNFVWSLHMINKHWDFYDSSEWSVKIIDEQLAHDNLISNYFWQAGENISLKNNIEFYGLFIHKNQKFRLLKDSYFLFKYDSKIYSLRFCNNSFFILSNKNKEFVNKDVEKLILIYENISNVN
ncbi:MAG: hypothetical protein HDR43_02020 [Mycoplasma sp.]|nr:hypothetical protein [Mycoplasma sp.]